ncbi:hypothetical protein RHSIM_Rhsim13G0078200 [Rhododendron simsii]|uniref:RING-type E3 ubiquitin transferase n=1 Tax=Rhododendron simsii TaxID=118357 RepID=A0A834L7E1_RHOSS|nr:hypothetical protein RHSIM_Rhsim13G0078200 [Rhododendron simsii]
MESTASYWCHRCTRFVRVWSEESLVCPHCDSGFIEAVTAAPPPSDSPRPFPAAAMYMIGPTRPDPDRASNLRSRRQRRNHGDRSPFNPVIVLRGPADESRDDDGGEGGGGGGERRSFELYYNDGAGSGLRPLPAAMSEFLMGSGFDRLLDQLSQIEINGLGRHEQPPASKSAVESMPTVEIVAGHVNSDSHCAVCKEAFVIGSEAREMPCKHIYHSDCILPWLSLRNSCPVCRHELPAESASSLDLENGDEETVGLTIWRLPGGGFAVGSIVYWTVLFGLGGSTTMPGSKASMVYLSDIESGFPGFIPERRALRLHAARPINANSLAFLVTVLLMFTILNSHQMSPNFLLWIVLGIFLMATSLRMFATCQQLQAQAQAHAAAASGLLGHTEFRLQMPPSIALATRGRLQGLRLQLALLDREFDDLDYETLRALDTENNSSTPSMSEEEINALPVHKYKASSQLSDGSSLPQASSSSASPETDDTRDPEVSQMYPMRVSQWLKSGVTPEQSDGLLVLTALLPFNSIDFGAELVHAHIFNETKPELKKADSIKKALEDELTCTICLEQVNRGELVRSLPCLHQFHANCIDPWLRQQGTCPVCKLKVGSGWPESRESDTDGDDMV